MKRILLVSSSGGHYEQLMVLKNNLKKYYEIFVITEKTNYSSKEKNTFYLRQLNRKKISFPFLAFINHLQSKKIVKKIEPDIVISTGALASISPCFFAKKMNKKIIFIESFAKINTPTKTGKFMYKYADYFIVQWPEMLSIYPKALYFDGGIY